MNDDNEIVRAGKLMEQRKLAAGGEEFERSQAGVMFSPQDLRHSWSGLGLDIGDAMEAKPVVARGAANALAAGTPPVEVVCGFYFEGVATGLLMAEQRKNDGG